jgi:hypothetical protein
LVRGLSYSPDPNQNFKISTIYSSTFDSSAGVDEGGVVLVTLRGEDAETCDLSFFSSSNPSHGDADDDNIIEDDTLILPGYRTTMMVVARPRIVSPTWSVTMLALSSVISLQLPSLSLPHRNRNQSVLRQLLHQSRSLRRNSRKNHQPTESPAPTPTSPALSETTVK